MKSLEERIVSALRAYCENKDSMHVPARDTDVDVVLSDCLEEITKLKQKLEKLEILASKHGSSIGKLHFTERKLGETQKETSELKAKLAKYESRDVVVLPRIPSNEMIEVIDVALTSYDSREVYKAMIEAGEIK